MVLPTSMFLSLKSSLPLWRWCFASASSRLGLLRQRIVQHLLRANCARRSQPCAPMVNRSPFRRALSHRRAICAPSLQISLRWAAPATASTITLEPDVVASMRVAISLLRKASQLLPHWSRSYAVFEESPFGKTFS